MTSALHAWPVSSRDAMDARRAAHTAPDDDAFAEALARLAARDDASWRMLLSELTPIARALACTFTDVTSPDDALGELALRAHEHWIEDWLERARCGRARVSLAVFLRDRMRDHLREERRRRMRRTALLSALPATALVPSSFDAPDDTVLAGELRARMTDGSPALDTVVRLRELGHDQREIARRTGSSAATVSRRLAALALALALGAVLSWLAVREPSAADVRASRAMATATATAPRTAPPEPPPVIATASDRERRVPVRVPTPPAASARLVVNALPWCTLSIDGRVVGPTPQMRTDVRAGVHRLSCVAADGRTRTQSVVVAPGETARVILRFD